VRRGRAMGGGSGPPVSRVSTGEIERERALFTDFVSGEKHSTRKRSKQKVEHLTVFHTLIGESIA
jgi:hypothetical protein